MSSVVSVGMLDGVLLGLLDGLLNGSSLGSLDGVSLKLLDGSLDRSSLGSLDGDEGGGSGNDDKTATTEENKYFGFVHSPDLFIWKKHVRNLFRGNGTENMARRVSSRQL